MSSRPLVVITEDLDPAPEKWLAARCEVVRCGVDEPRFGELLARADALVVRTYTIVDEKLLARGPRLRVVGRAGVGLDNFDLPACAARGVKVVSTPDANTRAVVEYVFAMLADATRPRVFLDAALDAKRWNAMRRELVGDRELNEMVMGIYGFGRIGSAVARVARAMEMETIYHDIREIAPGERHGATPVSREELLRRADVLTVHVDGRPENRGLLEARAFGLMREDVVFVNTSRGFIVDAAALAAFMRGHERAMALIDVHEPEPFGADYPLLGLKNVHLSAHLASGTKRAKENMSWVVRGVWEEIANGK
jgi:(S)-sulfolactate dehydrogenase